MGLLKLLTFPVTGPALGGKWVLQTLLDEAERQYYDEAGIRQQLAAVESDFRSGRLSEAEYDRREEALLERLLEARRYHHRKQAEGAERAGE